VSKDSQGIKNRGIEKALGSLIEESLDQYVELLQELLRIPCPRMEEHRAVNFIADKLRQQGCGVQVFEGAGEGEPTPQGQPINLFASRKGEGGGRSLMLASHLDCVPPGDLTKWKHGPWSGHTEDGRIYSRGAHDDRTGAAILCMVADLLRRLNFRTQGNLYFLATTEEEFSCGGMKAYMGRSDRVQADAYLEVDGNREFGVIVGLGGALKFQIRIEGPFGSAQQTQYVHEANPIELMGLLIQRLKSFEQALPSEPGWTAKIVAVTEIHSKGWLSNVPEECTVSGFANVLPPLTVDDYKTRFEEFVQKFAGENSWLSSHPPVISWGPLEQHSLVVPEHSEFLKILAEAHLKNFGVPVRPRKVGGWADAQMLGIPNTVLYGPGGGGGDHAYNEYFEIDSLAPILKTLVMVITGWCGQF
jgi:acetylornithine deacetylase